MEKPTTLEKTPAVSVIVPTYNQALYITEALQSVLDQTFPDFELIVVDDGSTDETPEILAGYHDPRIRVVRQPNAGLSAARNTGLRESSAPLITLLDSDDYFFPDKLAVLSAYLDNHPEIGLVSGGTQIVDQKGRPLRQVIKTPRNVDLFGLLSGNPFTPSAVMFRREWCERVGAFDETLRACEDWDLWLRMAYKGCAFAWVEWLVAAYRYHQGQMTRESERMRKAMLLMLDKFFSQPDLPEDIKVYKNKSYASVMIKAAAYAYHNNEFSNGRLDLSEAIQLDPTLKDHHYKRLMDILVGWSCDPRSAEPQEFMQRIMSNPPHGQPGLRRQLKRAVADVFLGFLFSSSQDVWRAHRWDLLRVVIYKPDWLLNRGVIRMIASSWFNF
jgi:glycosyltransferase involved in cell wall biosynthesis